MRRVGVMSVLWVSLAGAGGSDHMPSASTIECAESEDDPRDALSELARDTVQPLQLPAEREGALSIARAEQIDALLFALAEAWQRWPAKRDVIEELVLSWNYCDVFHGGAGWNVAEQDGSMRRWPAAQPRSAWAGFGRWGFTGAEGRIVPALLEQNSLGRGQREWFLSEVLHARCFPDPETGYTPFTDPEGRSVATGAVAVPSAPLVADRPLARQACKPETPAQVMQEAVVASVAPQPAVAPIVPLQLPGAQSAPSDALTTAQPVPGRIGLSGSVYESLALSGRATVGARFSYSPYANVYVRTGIAQAVARPAELPTYSWGLGYNDWHTDTISVELNHWGPIPIDRFDVKGATLDVGYKAPLPTVLSQWLGLSFNVSYPLASYPNMGLGVSAKPFRDWFVSAGVRWSPWNENQFSWTYGFGYWSWRPHTFSLAYNNWGPNRAFDPNFERNGSLSCAFSWAL